MNLKQLFRDSINKLLGNDNSDKAYKDLEEGKSITWKPRSDRYTYENQHNTDYNSKWKPETKEEKKTLTPEGYFRTGDRKTKKDIVKSNVFEKALAQGKTEDEANEDAENELMKEKQISIDSTALNQIKYNPETRELKVIFENGNKEYFYPSVPPDVVKELMEAPSKGEYFMSHIHDQYSLYGKDHSPKNKKQQRTIKKFQKRYNKDSDYFKNAITNARKTLNKHRGIGK